MAALNSGRLKLRAALVLTILVAIGMTYYYVAMLLPATRATEASPIIGRSTFGNDFYPLWLTSRECILRRIDPYSPPVTREIQAGIFGRAHGSRDSGDPPTYYHAFSHPAFADIFGLAVAWLPFGVAKIVLAIVFPILTAISIFLWSKGLRWRAGPSVLLVFTVLTLSSYPGLEGLYHLQPGLIVGFLLAAAFAALVQNKQRSAGCLLALATMKPQVSVLLILYLLMWALASWRERQKFAITFLTTLATLCFSTMLLWPNWVIHWIQMLFNYSKYSRPPLLLGLFGQYLGSVLLVLALSTTLKLAWDLRREPAVSFEFGLTVSLLLAVTTVTLFPEHAFYDQVVLLPGIMIGSRSWRTTWARNLISKGTLALAGGTLLWSWISVPVTILVQAVVPRLSSAILFLPIRTAAATPFVIVGLLLLKVRQMKEESLLQTRLA